MSNFTRCQPAISLVRTALLAAACVVLVSCSDKTSETQLLDRARKSVQDGALSSAQVDLKALLAQNPQSGEARLLLGRVLLQSGDPRAAAVELEKARDQGQRPADVVPDLALALLRSFQIKRVIDNFAGVDLEEKEATAQLRAVVATAHIAQGAVDKGSALVAEALALAPGNGTARILEARLLAGGGKTEEAVTKARELVKDQPKNVEAHQLLGELLFYAKADPSGATIPLEAALAIRPTHAPAHHALINMALQSGDKARFKQRVSDLKRAMPNSLDAAYYEARLALMEGDLARARELTDQLMKVSADAPAVLTLAGETEMRRGSWARAEAHFSKALQRNPESVSARRALARIHQRSGREDRAMQLLAPLLQRMPADAESLVIAAEIAMAAGRIAEAEGYLQTSLKQRPNDARLKSALALVRVAKGDAQAGLADLDALAAADDGHIADLGLISARMRRGEFREAQAAIERLKAKEPTKAFPHQLQGQFLAGQADPAGARRAFDAALAADPGYFPAIAQLTALDLREGKAAEAASRINAFIQKNPGHTAALLALADLKSRSKSPAAEVESQILAAIRSDPGHEGSRLALIKHRLTHGNQDGARQAAQEGVAALPDSVSLLEALAKIQLAAGERQSALSLLQKVNNLLPSYEQGYLNLADAYYSMGDLPSAERSLKRAIEAAPNSVLGQAALVRLAVLGRRLEEARAIAKTLQKSQPNEPAGWLLEAEVLNGMKQPAAAAEVLRSASARLKSPSITVALYAVLLSDPSGQEAEKVARQVLQDLPRTDELAHRLALAALQRGRPAAAERIYVEMLRRDPNDALVLNNLSMAMALQDKPEALGYAERADKLSPGNPVILDSLARALALNGQGAKAIEVQQLAIAKSSDGPQFRLGLAKLHLRLNQRDLARAELEKLKALGADFPAQAEVNSLLAQF